MNAIHYFILLAPLLVHKTPMPVIVTPQVFGGEKACYRAAHEITEKHPGVKLMCLEVKFKGEEGA